MKTSYQTPTRRAILSLLAAYPHRQFTAEQICTLLCRTNDEGGALVGKSTIYRQLSQLCRQNAIRRYDARDGESAVRVYQAVVREEQERPSSLHLKCCKCGRVTRLNCTESMALIAHIAADHAFSVDCAASILQGVCRDCSAGAMDCQGGTADA